MEANTSDVERLQPTMEEALVLILDELRALNHRIDTLTARFDRKMPVGNWLGGSRRA